MHYTFSPSTIASLSGTVFLAVASTSQVVASVNFAYDESINAYSGSIRAARKTRGTECSFVNAFKVDKTLVDTGILECGSGLTCVEDETSSLGGRCNVLMDMETNIESRRLLVDCTFSDGTTGTKCVGANACTGSDITKIGCGSCLGDQSCRDMYAGVTVGENSCLGDAACHKAGHNPYDTLTTSLTIKDGSCHDNVACKFLRGECNLL